MTTWYEHINNTVGVLVDGTVRSAQIAWPTFAMRDGTMVYANRVTIAVSAGGVLAFALPSNCASTPHTYYTITFDVSPTSAPLTHAYYSAQVILPETDSLVTLADVHRVTQPWL